MYAHTNRQSATPISDLISIRKLTFHRLFTEQKQDISSLITYPLKIEVPFWMILTSMLCSGMRTCLRIWLDRFHEVGRYNRDIPWSCRANPWKTALIVIPNPKKSHRWEVYMYNYYTPVQKYMAPVFELCHLLSRKRTCKNMGRTLSRWLNPHVDFGWCHLFF